MATLLVALQHADAFAVGARPAVQHARRIKELTPRLGGLNAEPSPPFAISRGIG
jgi:hypothetical protein